MLDSWRRFHADNIETFARIIIAIRTVKNPLSESIKYQNSPKQQEFSKPHVFWFTPPLSTNEFGVTFVLQCRHKYKSRGAT
jgi:hypothetical protein